MGRALLIVSAVAVCGIGALVGVRMAGVLRGGGAVVGDSGSAAIGSGAMEGGRLDLPPVVDSRGLISTTADSADSTNGIRDSSSATGAAAGGGVPALDGIALTGDRRAAAQDAAFAVIRSALPFLASDGVSGSAKVDAVQWAGERRERELGERLQRAEAALAKDPDHEAALADAVDALREMGQWSGAADLLGRLARISEDAAQRVAHADALLRAARWIDAIEPLRSLAEANPDDERVRFNLAVALTGARRLSEARRAWDDVISGLPVLPEPVRERVSGPSPNAVGPDTGAGEPSSRASANESSEAGLLLAIAARRARGEVLLDLRLWEEAAADLAVVAAMNPSDGDAAMNLALALFQCGRAAEAESVLRLGLAHQPRSVPLRNRLAELRWTLLHRSAERTSDGQPAQIEGAVAADLRRAAADARGAFGADVDVMGADVREIVRLCDESLEIDPAQPLIRALRERAAVWPGRE
ncbi:MAG: tetratricopeptide repeat protein [Phycisphaerales bacterium]|nr:tetratricopeptide repeat protein [Phycisphaerales bacterium]